MERKSTKDRHKYHNRQKRRRKSFPFFQIGLMLVVFAAGVLITSWWIGHQPRSQVLSVDPNAGKLVTPEPKQKPAGPEPDVAIAGWSKITVPANSLKATTSLYNPQENEGYYYLTYELLLKETEEVIFETGLIPPGLSCNEVALSRELEAGNYPAILHVQPYRMDVEQSPTNNANLELMLVVE